MIGKEYGERSEGQRRNGEMVLGDGTERETRRWQEDGRQYQPPWIMKTGTGNEGRARRIEDADGGKQRRSYLHRKEAC